MSDKTQIISSVLAIDPDTKKGRTAAIKAIQGICEEFGIEKEKRAIAVDVLFGEADRPHISFSEARQLLGNISRPTFLRWRKANVLGLGEITVITINPRRSDAYLDEILEAKKRMETPEI